MIAKLPGAKLHHYLICVLLTGNTDFIHCFLLENITPEKVFDRKCIRYKLVLTPSFLFSDTKIEKKVEFTMLWHPFFYVLIQIHWGHNTIHFA